MPEIQKVTDKFDRVIWNQRQVTKKPDLKPIGKDWVMDTMPFHAVLRERLTDDKPLQYLCGGKYISFKPIGGQSSKGLLSLNKRSICYKDGLGAGISLEVHTSISHWRKLIRMDSLQALDISGEFVEFTFEVETDFNIPERENKKPRIKLGENSYIEVAQAWDSSPIVEDEETGETSENKISTKSFFKRVGGKLYFIKQIPTDWLKAATFPVWTDTDIAWGTAQEFGDTDHTVDFCQCCEIDTNKFVVVYTDRDDGDSGQARVGTVSGTTITWGAISEFCADIGVGLTLGVCKLDTDKFVVVYADDTAGDDGFARVGTVATRTITWGTAKEFETGDTEYPSCCQLEIDKFAIVYNDETVGDKGTVCICTVSNSTITAGTPVAFEGRILDNRCCKLDTDKFVAFYRDYGDSSHAKACAFTVVDTTPTAGAVLEIDSASCRDCECAQLDTDKFVIVWGDGTSGTLKAEICTVSTTTITEGAEVELSDSQSYELGVCKWDATHFVVVYDDQGNSFKGTCRYCSFSNTTITLGDEEIFHDAATKDEKICPISADKVVVVYMDDADANDIGEAIVGDWVLPPVLGTVTLSGVGTLATIGRGIFIGEATLSGTGILAAIGRGIFIGKATLSGTGTLGAIGEVVKLGIATLSGIGTLTASAVTTLIGKATLSGTGTLVTSAVATLVGKVTLAGTGTLAGVGYITAIGKATLSGVGTLAALGQRITYGVVTLSGTGTLAGIAHITAIGKATLSGVGTLSAIGQRICYGIATLAGTGTLAAIGRGIFIGKATLSGQGSLSAIGSFLRYGIATLSGIGTLTASGVITAIGKATLSGLGTLVANGVITAIGKATLSGIGTLTAKAGVFVIGKAVLAGIGSLSVVGRNILGGVVTMSGVGTLTASGFLIKVIEITLALYDRAITAKLYARSLTTSLYSRAINAALCGRDFVVSLPSRVATLKMRTK